MGFVNAKGYHVSYDCSELIEELKEDIAEFGGDTIVNVWCTVRQGVELYVNYDFISKDMSIKKEEVRDNEYIKSMTMFALLTLLEQQNSIL